MSELIARHHGALVRLADSIVRNRAVAEEVAQEPGSPSSPTWGPSKADRPFPLDQFPSS